MAMPMPPPMHSVARPFLALRRCISCSSVTSTRAPEAPMGWPMAMAPPFTLTLPVSQPRSLLTAQAWAANASLASTRSRSSVFQPAFFRASRDAGIGPGMRPGDDAGERSLAEPGRLARLHQYDGGRAIIDARRVAGRHGAFPVEGRAQLADDLRGRSVLGVLVGVHHDVALARLHG